MKQIHRSILPAIWGWIILAIALWGLPAVIFWSAVGFSWTALTDQMREEKFVGIERKLEEAAGRIEPSRFLEGILQKEWGPPGWQGLLPKENNLSTFLGEFEKRFPKGLFEVSLFDGSGKAVRTPLPKEEAEALFSMIRKPLTEKLTLSPEEEERLGRVFPFPKMLAARMKGRPGRVVFLGIRGRFSFGFFQWNPEVLKQTVAGVMVFIRRELLPDKFILDQVLKEVPEDGVSLSYDLDVSSGPARPDFGDAGFLDRLRKRFQQEPGNRFSEGSRIAAFRRVDDTILLFGAGDLPKPPVGILIALFALYFFPSLLFLRMSYRLQVLGTPPKVAIRTKLWFFMALAFGLPCGLAIWVGKMYLDDFRKVLLQNHQEKSLARLAEIDGGFAGFPRAQEGKLHKFLRNLDPISDRPEELKREVNRLLFENRADHVMLISSESVLVNPEVLTICDLSQFRKSFSLPLDKRLALLEHWKIGRYAFYETDSNLVKFMTRPDDDPEKLQAEREGICERFMSPDTGQKDLGMLISRVTFADFFHREAQRRNDPSLERPREMVTNLLAEEAGFLLNHLRERRGQFSEILLGQESLLFFFDFILNSSGLADYCLLVRSRQEMFEREFLEPVMAANGGFGSETRLLALSGYFLAGDYPDSQTCARVSPFFRKMEAGQREVLEKTREGGEDLFLVGRRCRHLRHYGLFTLTSAREVFQPARVLQFRFLLVLAALSLGVIVFFGLLQRRFLTSVGLLSEGLSAMKEKRFGFRIKPSSDDELGNLCREFNQALHWLEEMEVAHSVQRAIMPHGTARAGPWEVVGKNLMVQAIGGDFFDFIPVSGGRIAVVFGDVAGHGISAALVAVMAKSAFSLLCPQYPDRPDEVLSRVNRLLLEQLHKIKMMTCFLAILDPEKGSITYSNAGQNYPIHLLPDGNGDYVKIPPSKPLGVSQKCQFSRFSLTIGEGCLVLYSDGVIECANKLNELLNYDGFLKVASETLSRDEQNAEERIESLFARVRKFTGAVPWPDDVSVVIIHRPKLV